MYSSRVTEAQTPKDTRLLFASLFASRLRASYLLFKRKKSPSPLLPAETSLQSLGGRVGGSTHSSGHSLAPVTSSPRYPSIFRPQLYLSQLQRYAPKS